MTRLQPFNYDSASTGIHDTPSITYNREAESFGSKTAVTAMMPRGLDLSNRSGPIRPTCLDLSVVA